MSKVTICEVIPPSARVCIFEVTLRSGYELVTDARRDDRVFVGMKQWRAAQKRLAADDRGPAGQ
jgi:hypothetical protein